MSKVFDLKDFKITFQLSKSDTSSPLWANGIKPFIFTGHGDEETTVRMIPEDDGQIAFIKRGALGDIWANKNYRGMGIWSLDISVLPQHPDEFRFKQMLAYAMDARLPEFYIEVKDRNNYKSSSQYTTWESESAIMVKIPAEFGFGYNTDGSRHFQFYLPQTSFNPGDEIDILNEAPGVL